MTKITAHFTDKNAAQRAREQLENADKIAASRMHIWNDVGASSSSSHGAESGALIGGALFGVSGLLGGAALGDSYDNAPANFSSSKSVRLVVEIDAENERVLVENALRDAGATRVEIS